jgi:SAM-dependent methyltransferase
MTEAEDPILLHYRDQARTLGHDELSTMADETTRRLELDAILTCMRHALGGRTTGRVLEIGCGNGLLLARLRDEFPDVELSGCDYTPEMVELAQARGVERCAIRREDVRALGYADSSFDVVVAERCLINVLDRSGQERSLQELHRVLAPGGSFVMIEAFSRGLENLNRARDELGLEPNVVPHHNLWFDRDWFAQAIAGRFEPVEGDDLPPENFLSSHYFISRVVYPAVTRREVMHNTEFVKFFSFLPPRGEFAAIQLRYLRRIG